MTNKDWLYVLFVKQNQPGALLDLASCWIRHSPTVPRSQPQELDVQIVISCCCCCDDHPLLLSRPSRSSSCSSPGFMGKVAGHPLYPHPRKQISHQQGEYPPPPTTVLSSIFPVNHISANLLSHGRVSPLHSSYTIHLLAMLSSIGSRNEMWCYVYPVAPNNM